jgi:hypothetical protein
MVMTVAEVVDTGSRDASGSRRGSAVQRWDQFQAYRGSGMSERAFAKNERGYHRPIVRLESRRNRIELLIHYHRGVR